MRINRIIALLLFIISLIVISFQGGPAAYGFFFFTVFVPLVSLIYTFIVYSRFKIYQEIGTRTLTAGNATPFYFTLQNEDLFSHAGIRVHFFSDFSEIYDLDEDTEYELFPRCGIKKETVLVCKYRGEYEIGIKSVTITDYLRLFSITFKNKETLRATVMPRIDIIETSDLDETLKASGSNQKASQVPDIPVRDYVPGDDIRLINWKATARSGKPEVRTFCGENSRSVSIIMDSVRYEDDPASYLPLENKILETVIALAYYYSSKGIGVHVFAHKDRLLKYDFDDISTFLDSYRALSAFAFRPSGNNDRFFAECSEDRNLLSSSSHILVLHRWSPKAGMLSDILTKYSSAPALIMVTDDPGQLSSISGNENVKAIGYHDKPGEVFR